VIRVPPRSTPRQRRDDATQLALRRVLDLPGAEQLKIYAVLRENLGGEIGEETAEDKKARRRIESLECLQRAAEYLGLTDRAPTGAEYRSAAAELHLPMSSEQIIRAWDMKWSAAAAAFEGQPWAPTARQRGRRRALLGQARANEDPITSVRIWLATEPDSETMHDYTAFAAEYNERRPKGEPRLPTNGDDLRNRLRLRWSQVLAVAREEIALEEAQAARVSELLDESGPLVSISLAAFMLEMSPSTLNNICQRANFPNPVARIQDSRVWLRTDIEAYRETRPNSGHSPYELQQSFVDSNELAERLELRPDRVRTLVYNHRWDRVPEAAGKVGHAIYWRRSAVEDWFRERDSARDAADLE
jgi:predicted DNA-binding transcriptional regulator AlpA